MPDILLRSSHLIIPSSIAVEIFQKANTAYISYKQERKSLLISPNTNSWFPKLHESKECLLKNKDLEGSKSISIRELLIDHDINAENRTMAFEVNTEKRYIKIDFRS